jgi:hypothetical protein
MVKVMKRAWLITGAVVAAVAGVAGMAALYSLPLDRRDRSPVQPLAFSHKVHAGDNAIPCLYCHRLATTTRLAGIPAVADCRACHLYISPDAPEVKKLLEYWDKQQPIPWVRVYKLSDHVYFPHMMHLRAKLDCATCHGDVATMERVTRSVSIKMGWCLDCHRHYRASIDCWTCHI